MERALTGSCLKPAISNLLMGYEFKTMVEICRRYIHRHQFQDSTVKGRRSSGSRNGRYSVRPQAKWIKNHIINEVTYRREKKSKEQTDAIEKTVIISYVRK